jgi:ketosteroid isomerase-like protein
MKYIAFLSVFLFTIIGCTNEQPKETTEPISEEVNVAEEEIAVAEAVNAFNQAMINPDTETFSNLVSDGVSYGHSGGVIQNKAEFLDDIVNGTFKFLTPANEDQTIAIVGNNAIVRHIFTSEITNKGVPGELRIGNLQVWVKEDGKWKLLARQAYKLQ